MLKSLHIFLLSLMLLVAPMVASAGVYADVVNPEHASHCVDQSPASTHEKQLGHGSSCQSMCILSAYAPAAGVPNTPASLSNQLPTATFSTMLDEPAFQIYKPPEALS